MVARDHPLVGVWAKIQRANKHIMEFSEAKKAFLESHPVTFTHNEDPNTGFYNVSIADIKPAPPELSLIIGDAIHNLRSALDLLACQLVKLQVHDHDCSYISFPISGNSQKFMDELNKPKMQLMGKHAMDILQQWQPYKGGKRNELWELHRLDIQDKHRLLIVAPTSIDSWHGKTVFTPSLPNLGHNRVFDTGAAVPFNDLFVPKIGDLIVGIDPKSMSTGTDGELRIKFQFIGDIAFNEPGIIRRKSALNKLVTFHDVVIGTIKQFEPLFP